MPPARRIRPRPPPPGFTDLGALPGVRLRIGYHRADNFTGAPLPGYGAPGAWLLDAVAAEIAGVRDGLLPLGLGLVVYDAYRPRRATLAMVRFCRTHGKEHLLDGWVSADSHHNRATTIDLGLCRLDDGAELDHGTAWDAFEPRSHLRGVDGPALEHRLLLNERMVARGFVPYSKEWWHFRLPVDEEAPVRDVPYGADEPDEGAWRPPW